ncbi:hypothetical protein QUB05_26350 [Microcoleus sp. F10-C6]|uniref:hypothetical protein n=1 Tax=unclassified Microcoleus TaxID=2642155 RepID=UPI002FD67610
MSDTKNMKEEKAFLLVRRQIQGLFREAEIQNWSFQDFAVKVWLGTILGLIPEKTLASILVEKAANIPAAETYKLIDDLAAQSREGKKEAMQRAVKLLLDGLLIINNQIGVAK